MTKPCVVLVLLAGTVVSGMRLKTAKEQVNGDVELLDFDKTSEGKPEMDFYADSAEAGSATACTKEDVNTAYTDAAWLALDTKMVKTPSNYCHKTKGNSWFCFAGTCQNTATAGSGACTLADASATHGGPDTEDKWHWDMLQYDENFGCVAETIEEDSCEGPYPSLSCNSRGKEGRVNAGQMPRTKANSYCWGGTKANEAKGIDFKPGKCYDVSIDKEVCTFTRGSNSKTDDGWKLKDMGYDWGFGCQFTHNYSPVQFLAGNWLNFFNSWNKKHGSIQNSVADFIEPWRQLFMEIYPIRNQLNGWKNKKQKTGYLVDPANMGNTEHDGAR